MYKIEVLVFTLKWWNKVKQKYLLSFYIRNEELKMFCINNILKNGKQRLINRNCY